METHPDRCPPDSDKALFTKRFMRAKTAYEILKDPLLRREVLVAGWSERERGFLGLVYGEWGARVVGGERGGGGEEEDEDVGFVAKMRRKMGKMFQSDTLVNEEEEGVTWDTVKVLGGVWSMERDPGELRRRNEAARAAAEWLGGDRRGDGWELAGGGAACGKGGRGGVTRGWVKGGMSTGRRNVKKVVMEATQGGKDGENALEDTSAGDAKRLDALVTVSAKSGDFEALEAKGGKDSKILGEDATGGEEDGGKRLIIDSKIVGKKNDAAEAWKEEILPKEEGDLRFV
ncbi:hypothetical protein BC829DRAFT_416644 [Chytridium lagenaria]|nr:hypothetical protein BC829DRAFT_416644 [Chytridium lagenaria]